MTEGLTSVYDRAQDTLKSLGIQEPLPVEGLGVIFWAQSYHSCQGSMNDYPDFAGFISQPWTTHYAIPQYGRCAFELKLPEPIKDGGFESVYIDYDSIMECAERNYCQDQQEVQITDLRMPRELVECMERLLCEWQGETLFIDYNCSPEENGDPTTIRIAFDYCSLMPTNPDMALKYVSEKLSEAMATTVE